MQQVRLKMQEEGAIAYAQVTKSFWRIDANSAKLESQDLSKGIDSPWKIYDEDISEFFSNISLDIESEVYPSAVRKLLATKALRKILSNSSEIDKIEAETNVTERNKQILEFARNNLEYEIFVPQIQSKIKFFKSINLDLSKLDMGQKLTLVPPETSKYWEAYIDAETTYRSALNKAACVTKQKNI